MSTKKQDLSDYQINLDSGEDMKIGVVVSDWNSEITHNLLEACRSTLLKEGLKTENIHAIHVPGAFELPMGAKLLDDKYQPDAIICLGCVIKGETSHDAYINQAVANALMHLAVLRSKPYVFGLITTNNMAQAQDRAGGAHGNKGVEAAVTAMKMILVKRQLKHASKTIGF